MDQRLSHKPSQKGVTLIEVLVVLAILAMTASVVVFTAPPTPVKARSEAEGFAARLNAASEYAVMSGTLIGLELTPSGYQFFRYERGEWKSVDLGPVAETGAFPADVAVEVELAESVRRNEKRKRDRPADEAPAPNVFFTPTGETTAFDMSFTTRRGQIKLSLDNAGDLTVTHDDQI